jgi:deoxyribodipyrimidine photo-lyase
MPVVIWWIRRDIRLTDNQALACASQEGKSVIPLYILDPYLLDKAASRRRDFLFNNLHCLAQNLENLGSRLIVRQGNPLHELDTLFHESGAERIFAERDYSPYARRRDRSISKVIPLTLTTGVTIHPPGLVVKPDSSPYTVFTPFNRSWKNFPSAGKTLPAPESMAAHPSIASIPIPPPHPDPEFPAGEYHAQSRLKSFLMDSIFSYTMDRDRMDLEGTSRLSPYLRFGILSPRWVLDQLNQILDPLHEEIKPSGCESWLNELIWREFFIQIMSEFPIVLKRAFRKDFRRIPWRNSPQDLAAWQNGLTGYPVVDAAMRQLRETGWIHNRARMISASFLTKDLLINWQSGEAWFMRHLIDGDPASNNGGWQWTAGTGVDAAPYFRVFNPVLQGKKYDPNGNHVRCWVPELASLPDAYIHEPWKTPPDIQSHLNLKIGRDYPEPIVDHQFARKRALAAYNASKTLD